jgi:hypothetical protein
MHVSITSTITHRALACCFVTALAGPALAMDAHKFTFADAEYGSAGDGMSAARTFVHDALPAGLPMGEAASRVEHADARCLASPSGAVNCSFSTLTRPHDDFIGEDVWAVQLTPGADGVLGQATLTRSRY